jgi:type II secretory ATPase GspE/PulE/Tfp pilus assembly ATPase PilB-like protein
MAGLLLAVATYGGYISPIKLAVFLVLFFLWLLLISWVYKDAQAVGTKEVFWTSIVVGVGAAATIIWLIVPVFIVGILFYLVAVGTVLVSYVIHRNAKVPEFNRVLTAEHIKGLLSSGTTKTKVAGGEFVFITANNNEVPMPEPKTPDFFGYRAACELFINVKRRRASDIVFSVRPESCKVTYYVDGVGLQQPDLAKEQTEYLIRFLKNLADLDPDEKRKPQAGRFTVMRDEEDIEWELKTAGSTAGEQVVLRQVAQHQMKKLDEMGLTAEQYQQLSKLRQVKEGVFIIAGPKGSGVTTTFYALLRCHDAFLNSINTLERQPSAELQNITQNVFTLSNIGTTSYGKRLESMIRMGSDIVGVADCEDAETAKIASAAAKDAKLIYVTLESDNVMQALGKWIKLVGDRNLVAETLLGISAQRLLRKLCERCRQGYEPNKELLKKFNIPAEKAKVLYRAGEVVYDKRGKATICEDCQGAGFLGRTGIFEVIMIDDRLREVIKRSESLSQIGTEFRRAKMLYLQELALEKVVAGETAISEMLRIFSTKKNVKEPQRDAKK